ncbi:magnesium transporter CorA family protein [Methylocella sp.]|uniref:magnesium transporter CorA family protein n=1 Tax=Methylocella sp. TaxID=1978226 RepID=UPI0035B04A15
MLTLISTASRRTFDADLDSDVLPEGVNWIDAFRPDEREAAYLERAMKIAVPTYARLSEIETSSRLYRDKDHLYMSLPAIVRLSSGSPQTSPLGFVLNKDLLLTIRYKQMKACEDLHYAQPVNNRRAADGPSALITLLEAIIDRAADELEKIHAELDSLSASVFADNQSKGPEKTTDDLRRIITRVGRAGDLTSKIADVLLGVGRMAPFVATEAADYLTADERAKIKSLSRDIASLNDYETRQTDKIQFLLDATLGLTGIEQNVIFRILTIVSVMVGPPTVVAGVYGMNFKYMPELEWPFGYAFGLAMVFVSALIPFIWFKKRGWL